MHGNFVDLTGRIFGRLTVLSISKDRSNSGSIKWICKCDCGEEVSVKRGSLTSGKTESCGCLKISVITKHGHCKGVKVTSEYNAWIDMIKRCTKTWCKSYPRYGGRGITVCDRWLNSFDAFIEDMGPKPGPEYSLDRYPNNESGNYEKSNCRWGTDEVQSRNRRSNKWVEHNGIKMINSDWANFIGIQRGRFGVLLKTMTISEIINKYKK